MCVFGLAGQDDESAEEVQEQLRREWGTVSVSNEQSDYQVDTSVLQGKVRSDSCAGTYDTPGLLGVAAWISAPAFIADIM